ncbi:MAG: FecR domain-containing protein [Epsilonproteobacteria bacterium]|nr:FecR domain-containing protein [Campylobacterota bacterium]
MNYVCYNYFNSKKGSFCEIFHAIFIDDIFSMGNEYRRACCSQGDCKSKNKRVTAGYILQEDDILVTSQNSFAKLLLKDDSLVLLDQNAIMHFFSCSEMKQERGKVYYKITAKKVKNALRVKTDFAIIGIKGTVFIVKSDEKNRAVLLQEGLVQIDSIKEEFALYKKRVNEEFNKFKTMQNDGFENFKKSQYEKVAMVKSFDLHAMNKVVFDGNKVKEDDFQTSDNKEFEYFQQLNDEI